MTRVVLLANAFPYGDWEPYLETEVEYYEPFERVDLVALSVRPDQAEHERPLPGGNIVVHPIRYQSKLVYLLWGFAAIDNRDFWDELRMLVRTRRLSARRLYKLLIFVARASFEARAAIRELRAAGLGRGEGAVLYSYRMEYHAYLALLIKRAFPELVTVLRGHGYDLYEFRDGLEYMPLRRVAFESADRLFAAADASAAYLRERYPRFAAKIETRVLGTSDHGLGPLPDRSGPIRILTCSAIVKVKRLDRVVDALRLIDGPDVEWTHIGDGPLRDELEASLAGLPATVSVKLLGALDHDALMAHLARTPYDLVINSSESEGGRSVAVSEAQSFGIPAIVTDAGGNPELVDDGVNGFLVGSPDEPAGIARAIEALAAMPTADAAAMRTAARSWWSARADADAVHPPFVAELVALGAR